MTSNTRFYVVTCAAAVFAFLFVYVAAAQKLPMGKVFVPVPPVHLSPPKQAGMVPPVHVHVPPQHHPHHHDVDTPICNGGAGTCDTSKHKGKDYDPPPSALSK
jgi:hypothetical protein